MSNDPNLTFQGVKKRNTFTSLSAAKLYFNARNVGSPSTYRAQLKQNYENLSIEVGDPTHANLLVFNGKKQVSFATHSSSS
jgi:hypothetical protein